MSTSNPPRPAPPEQSIEKLTQRFNDLEKKKMRAEAERDTADKQLEKLRAEAREKYGTDDVGALQRQLDEMIAENTRKRVAYQADLDNIERSLAEVERQFAAPATPPLSGPPLNPGAGAASR